MWNPQSSRLERWSTQQWTFVACPIKCPHIFVASVCLSHRIQSSFCEILNLILWLQELAFSDKLPSYFVEKFAVCDYILIINIFLVYHRIAQTNPFIYKLFEWRLVKVSSSLAFILITYLFLWEYSFVKTNKSFGRRLLSGYKSVYKILFFILFSQFSVFQNTLVKFQQSL